MKTYSAKPSEVKKNWHIIDAKDLVLGRLASQVSILLRGKHKPMYTPHIDCGDHVVIVNAKYIHLSGRKSDKKNGKFYYRHTGYPGGIKTNTAGKILTGKYPERVLYMSIKRMISRNKIGSQQIKKLYIYPDYDHQHTAQKPVFFDIVKHNKKNKK